MARSCYRSRLHLYHFFYSLGLALLCEGEFHALNVGRSVDQHCI